MRAHERDVVEIEPVHHIEVSRSLGQPDRQIDSSITVFMLAGTTGSAKAARPPKF